MTRVALILLFLVAACSRPLTEAEAKFAEDLFGPSLDLTDVRISQGFGLTPPYQTVPKSVTRVRGTDRACLRTPAPSQASQPPQAFALYNRMFFDSNLYSSDLALEWPNALRWPQAIVLAHELTHVWQWQNRERTGYTPWRAASESLRVADPYFSTIDDAPEFFAFGYEQQAAIVEDFVCFTIANPSHPRRAELRTLLAPVLPVDAFEAAIQ